MKRLVKKLTRLLLLLVPVVLVLNFLGVQAGKVYKDGAALVCEAKREMVRSGAIAYHRGKTNVLFMGTSRILAGIQPRLFDRLTGGTTVSYNLALPALTVGSSFFVLRDYLKRNPPPDCLILQLDINTCSACLHYNYYASQGMSGWGEMWSLFTHARNKAIAFNFFFPFRMYKFHTFRYIYNSIFNPARIGKLKKYNRQILERMKSDRGYFYIQEQAENWALLQVKNPEAVQLPGERHHAPQFDPYSDPYTRMFFNLARDRGIRVVLIQAAYRENRYFPHEKIPHQFAAILGEYANVETAAGGWHLKAYPDSLFADKVHLNPRGAERYTREIFREYVSINPGTQEK